MAASYPAHVAAGAATTARALEENGFDRVPVHSGGPCTNFADAAPVDGPYHLLDVVPGRRPRLVRVQPRDYWYAPPAPAPDFVRHEFEIVEVATPDEAWKEIGAAGGRAARSGA